MYKQDTARSTARLVTAVAALLAVAAVAVVLAFVWLADAGDDANGATDTEGLSGTQSETGAGPATTTDPATGLVEATGFGDPAEVEVPAAIDPAAVVAWLEGDGHAAVTLLSESEPLWRQGAGACDQVARDLDAYTPAEVQAAAVGVADQPTSDILSGLVTATATALTTCGDPEEFEVVRAELAWQWLLADRRLDELGVIR